MSCAEHDDLTIAHLLSLEDGARLGATTVELYSDVNLAAMCEACNAGLRHGPKSISLRTYLTSSGASSKHTQRAIQHRHHSPSTTRNLSPNRENDVDPPPKQSMSATRPVGIA